MPGMPAHVKAKIILDKRLGDLPWDCWYCDEPITERPTVHHKNGNHDDHRSRNLVAVHVGCHTKIHKPWEKNYEGRGYLTSKRAKKFHRKGRIAYGPRHTTPHSEESKKKMGESKMGTHKGWTWKIKNGKRVWVKPQLRI